MDQKTMDQTVSEYDKNIRLKNMMWTISGDYSEEFDKLEDYAEVSEDQAIYYAAKIGARHKYFNWKMIKGYLNYRIQKGASSDILIEIAQICCDQIAENKLVEERPGMAEIRDAVYGDLVENYLLSKNRTLMGQVQYSLFFRQIGKSVQMDKKVIEIVKDFENNTGISDTLELIRKIENIYEKHFDGSSENIDFLYEDSEESVKILEQLSESSQEESYTFNDFMLDELYGEEEYDGQRESTESGKDSDSGNNDNKVISINEDLAEKLYSKIEDYYGKSYLNKNEIFKMEKKICRNAHEGCRVHFTEGVLRAQCNNSFQKKYGKRQKENNIAYYNSNNRVHKTNISKLKENISRTLTMEEERTSIPSEYGIIVPNRLWKVKRTNNQKVFNKIINNQKGGYVVDILLDASGSQRSRQGKIAAQGYIISQALTLAGIPNRVLSFFSFLDYTILRRFRDYDSPESENKNIFEYYATGNNRDGLAVRAVCEGLINRDEDHRILIILSDGKPNDMKITKSSAIRGETSYKGMKAIKDTALEVRRARKNGILILGVFTGKKEDLYAEKYIYGKDFFFTNNIEKFSELVGIFLKRIIENY